jgi:Cu-processing system ATP-binding protein
MITYRRFTKRFDRHCAVSDLTLDIAPGSVVALLGPNGSGKTTTIKAAAGLLRPTSGSVSVGSPPRNAIDRRARQRCSFLPQRVSFPEVLTGREVIEFYRRLRSSPCSATDRALHFAALNGASGRPVGTYSGGMMQRLGLAVAMLPAADVLLLDEPSAALDPEGLAALYELIRQRRRAGAAVFFSSHQLGDVERMADQIAVLVKGCLVAVMDAREVEERLAERGRMRVRMMACSSMLRDRVARDCPDAEWQGDELIVRGAPENRLAALDLIRAIGGDIRAISIQEGRLDDFYRELVEEYS